MSGGSLDYLYSKIDYTVCGKMEDAEMNDMMADLVRVIHDLEWYIDDDYGEEEYRKTVREFKQKWFEEPRTMRLRTYVDQGIDNLRKELYELIGESEKTDDERTD